MAEELGFSKGLAGVVADATSVSQVQGEVGQLIYRGMPLSELAAHSNFEEAAFFLLHGNLPHPQEFAEFKARLVKARTLSPAVAAVIDAAPREAHPMAVLQSAVAAMGYNEPAAQLKETQRNLHTAEAILSATATAVARISRHRRGLAPIAPDATKSHAENFLWMMSGAPVPPNEAKMFDVALILHMDHDFNASTFSARVVGSTESKLAAAISAAVGALSGPLHGGANEKVLEMADAIGSPEKAKEWVKQALEKKAKVNGFGHRVYRTLDPRARILRKMLEELVQTKTDKTTYQILLNVHDAMIEELSKKEKDYIWPNVDFWSGSLYRLMGIEPLDYTPIFTVARVVGWCSHLIEMWKDNRIYRPAAKYVGPVNVAYVPMEKRS